jgi:hypothetical protein
MLYVSDEAIACHKVIVTTVTFGLVLPIPACNSSVNDQNEKISKI